MIHENSNVQEKKAVVAFFLGMAVISSSIVLGRSYTFFASFMAFSVIMTFLWKRDSLPWIFLVSVTAATPLSISRYGFACNLIFALWFAAFNPRYFYALPKWLYVPAVLALLGILTSSINWMTGDVLRDLMRQLTFAYNLFLGPFLFLPLVYLRMRESRNRETNLKGLLFCLIVPSTLVLIAAKLFGSVANEWEASLHTEMLPEGFFQYQIGNVYVSFLRTEVGFILAALICASVAVTFSSGMLLYRLIAGVCFVLNLLLLLATGSFGSGFACICGLAAMFFTKFRTVNPTKALVSISALCCILFLSYSLSPPSVKEYLEKRYEHRVVKADEDRLLLWSRALEHFLEHPEGIGLTMAVGDTEKSFIHNDYLVYAVSYGLLGGLGYAILILALLVHFFRRRKSAENDPYALAINLAGLGVIVAIAINSMTDHMNGNRWYFNIIWSLIWYSYFCGSAESSEVVPAKIKRATDTSSLL